MSRYLCLRMSFAVCGATMSKYKALTDHYLLDGHGLQNFRFRISTATLILVSNVLFDASKCSLKIDIKSTPSSTHFSNTVDA